MAELLKIKSAVNGHEQTVTQEVFDALKKQGYTGKVISRTEAPKAAKTPEEVSKKDEPKK